MPNTCGTPLMTGSSSDVALSTPTCWFGTVRNDFPLECGAFDSVMKKLDQLGQEYVQMQISSIETNL